MKIIVAPCSLDAARTACERWHYSRRTPVGRMNRYGVWENDRFIGCIIFSRGASPQIDKRYGLDQYRCVELTRIAMREHMVPVSQVLAESIRLLRANNPKLRLLVSFADIEQGHEGRIYQAANWVYAGIGNSTMCTVFGKRDHWRNVEAKYGAHTLTQLQRIDPKATREDIATKHRYLYPLDKAMRRQILKIAQPYPCRSGLDSEPAEFHSEGAGATPATGSKVSP